MSIIKSAEPGHGSYEYADNPTDLRIIKRPARPTESLMEPPKQFKSVLKVDIATGKVLDGRFDPETGGVLYEKEKGDEKMPAPSPIPSREEVVELIKTCQGSINKMAQVKKVGWSTANKWVEHHGLMTMAQEAEFGGYKSEDQAIREIVGDRKLTTEDLTRELVDRLLAANVRKCKIYSMFGHKSYGRLEKGLKRLEKERGEQHYYYPDAEMGEKLVDEIFPVTPSDNVVLESLKGINEEPSDKELLSAVKDAEVAIVNRHEVVIELTGRMMEFPTREAALDYLKKNIRLYELRFEMVPVPLNVVVEEGSDDG